MVRPLFFIFIIICVCFCEAANAQKKKYIYSQVKMGSTFSIILYGEDCMYISKVAEASFKLVDSLNAIFSDYDSTSEVGKINANAGISPSPLSPLLFDLIMQSKKAYQQSDGTFNICMGALSEIWRKSRKQGFFPSKILIQNTVKRCQFQDIDIDTAARTVFLPLKGMKFDFGGIAKGYIAEQVLQRIKKYQIEEALVNAGGDIVAGKGYTAPWKIAINLPEEENEFLDKYLYLQNQAVATSGDVYQYTLHNGKKYGHIINPKTGYGVSTSRNVTVIANDGATADWLATACSILPLKKAQKLAETLNAQVLIATKKKGVLYIVKTRGFILAD